MDGPNLFSEKLSASQVPDVDSTVVRLTDANIARNSKGFSQKHGSCLLFSASRIFTSPNCLQKKSHVDMATFSCANKIAVLHTESRLPFFSGTTLLQLDLHQGSDQQPQLMVIGSSDPKCKKTTWMFGAKTDPWDLGVEHVTLQILTLSHMNIDKREMLNSKNPEDFDTNCCPSVMQPLVYKTNWLVPFFSSKNPTVKYWYRFTIDLP